MSKQILKNQVEKSDLLFMIEHAIKAPSGHNTQPWLFSVNNNAISILPDYKKSLPVVDSTNRELFFSLGCALENLCISASEKGYESVVEISSNGTISVHLKKNNPETSSALFKQIPLRQTNRRMYKGTMIPEATIALLKLSSIDPAVNIHFFRNGSPDFGMVKEFIRRGNDIQMQDNAFKSELKTWMRLNKKQTYLKRDGISYAVNGAPGLPDFLSNLVIDSFLTPKKQNKADMTKIESSSHLVLFTINADSVFEWVTLGRNLQRFLLQTTELGISHAYMNQPCEIADLASEMKNALKIDSEKPAILLRIGYADRMPYSLRRELSEVILN